MKWLVIKFCLVFLIAFNFSNCKQTNTQTTPIIKKNGVERAVYDPVKFPDFLAVGKIIFSNDNQCSIVLVDKNIAVTAGHCLHTSSLLKDGEIPEIVFHPPDSITKIIFYAMDGNIAGIYKVKNIIEASYERDFAILRLEQNISPDVVKPFKVKNLTLTEIIENEKHLGCAGFNNDRDLGKNGQVLTISRNVKIISEFSSKNRIDINCISTEGGSGGILFLEDYNEELRINEYFFVGVIWGVTYDDLDEKGNFSKPENIVTSITPIGVFYDELMEIIKKE